MSPALLGGHKNRRLLPASLIDGAGWPAIRLANLVEIAVGCARSLQSFEVRRPEMSCRCGVQHLVPLRRRRRPGRPVPGWPRDDDYEKLRRPARSRPAHLRGLTPASQHGHAERRLKAGRIVAVPRQPQQLHGGGRPFAPLSALPHCFRRCRRGHSLPISSARRNAGRATVRASFGEQHR